jgi:microcystin-dependent protein
MGTPFLGEVKMTSFNFAPKGWVLANGDLLPINQNQALFALYGTTFGGNGQTTFGLPNLRGRVPIHRGSFVLGQAGGEESHTLTLAEMPMHNHVPAANNIVAPDADGALPGNNKILSGSNAAQLYHPFGSPQVMNAGSIGNTGGSQPHNNMMPTAVISFCVALVGVFPSRN